MTPKHLHVKLTLRSPSFLGTNHCPRRIEFDVAQQTQQANAMAFPQIPPMSPFPILDLQGFRQILSPQMSRRYLMRQIGMAWYHMMEDVFNDVPAGTHILVRRDRNWSQERQAYILLDYITTREAHPTFLGRPWSHQDVAYMEYEVSPYPYDIDAFHQRNDILNNYRINLNLNPLPEGYSPMDMSEEGAPALPPLPEIQPLPPLSPLFALSSMSLLSSFQPNDEGAPRGF